MIDGPLVFFGSAITPQAAYFADPDQDGAINLLEYTFGTDPTDPASFPETVRSEILGPDANAKGIMYPQRSGGSAGYYLYEAEFSASPASWTGSFPGTLVNSTALNDEPIPGTDDGNFRMNQAYLLNGLSQEKMFFRVRVTSLSALGREIHDEINEVNAALGQWAIEANLSDDTPICWNCVWQYLLPTSRLKKLLADGRLTALPPPLPKDIFSNAYILGTVDEGISLSQESLHYLQNGTEFALHTHTDEEIARLINDELDALQSALGQWALENSVAPEAPVSFEQIKEYITRSTAPRLRMTGNIDPFGNAYVIGPTVDDPVTLNSAPFSALEDAGLIENGMVLLEPDVHKLLKTITDNLRILSSAVNAVVVENNLACDAIYTKEMLNNYLPVDFQDFTDPFGRPYQTSFLVQDGFWVDEITYADLRARGLELPDDLLETSQRLRDDLEVLTDAVFTYFQAIANNLEAPLNFEVLRPFLSDCGADLLQRNGHDLRGRPYLIGPTIADHCRANSETFAELEDLDLRFSQNDLTSEKGQSVVLRFAIICV